MDVEVCMPMEMPNNVLIVACVDLNVGNLTFFDLGCFFSLACLYAHWLKFLTFFLLI